jgi:hypothetical protein
MYSSVSCASFPPKRSRKSKPWLIGSSLQTTAASPLFSGVLSQDDAKLMAEAVADCDRIDPSGW